MSILSLSFRIFTMAGVFRRLLILLVKDYQVVGPYAYDSSIFPSYPRALYK